MQTDAVDFRADPLGWIDAFVAAGRSSAWIPGGPLCIADAEVGREVLWNAHGLYQEHSDFFGTPFGALPRELQIDMGRGVRQLLEQHLGGADLKHMVSRLAPSTPWPSAGNELVFRILRSALMSDDRTARFQRLVTRIVERRIYDRRPTSRLDVGRALLRRAFYASIREERAAYGRRHDPEPRDILDVLFGYAHPDEPDRRIAEVYASFLFATVGSIGFTLGWSLLLACSHGALEEEPSHIVSEALRLFPVAWFLGRRPAVDHAVLGETVSPRDSVVVSPYAIHRNPAYWSSANSFLPSRWAARRDRSAWTPFGAGPHACMAVSMSLDLAGRLLAEVRARDPVAHTIGPKPQLGAALAPPRFVVTLRA
jgi:cytochrome P450